MRPPATSSAFLLTTARGLLVETGDTMKGTIMKHRKIFSIALILGTLLWPLSFTSTEAQQNARRLFLDSGVIRLPASQTLRLTVNGQAGNDKLTVSFRRLYYIGSAN